MLVRVFILTVASGLIVLAIDELVGDGWLVGFVLVLVGGVVAVGSLVNAQPTAHAGAPGSAAPLVRSLDLLSGAEPPGSPPVRHFFYGLGQLAVGVLAVVLLG